MDRSFMCISCRIACVRDACLSCESDGTPSDVPPDERRRDAGLFKYLTRNNGTDWSSGMTVTYQRPQAHSYRPPSSERAEHHGVLAHRLCM
jgi:hypothetical protein